MVKGGASSEVWCSIGGRRSYSFANTPLSAAQAPEATASIIHRGCRCRKPMMPLPDIVSGAVEGGSSDGGGGRRLRWRGGMVKEVRAQ